MEWEVLINRKYKNTAQGVRMTYCAVFCLGYRLRREQSHHKKIHLYIIIRIVPIFEKYRKFRLTFAR